MQSNTTQSSAAQHSATQRNAKKNELINNKKNFFNNWKSYGNTIDEHNVNTLNAS